MKKLLKELGVTVTRESNAMALAREINESIKPGKTLSMEEISLTGSTAANNLNLVV